MKFSITLLALFCSLVLKSQDYYRIFESRYEYSGSNQYEALPENENSVEEYAVNLSLPIPRENGDAFVFGLGYNNLNITPRIKVEDPVPDTVLVSDDNYGRFRIQGGYSQKINDEFNMVYMGFFRVASDFVEVTPDHYLYGGLIMASKKTSDNFTLKYGMYANTEHYGWLLIPLVGWDWKINEKFRMFGILPRRMTAEWTLTDRFRAGAIFEAPNRSFRHSQNSTVVLSENKTIDTYVQYTKNVIYAFGEAYLGKGFVIRGRIGYTAFRTIELFEYTDEVSYMSWGVDYGPKRTKINDVPTYQSFQDNLVFNASIEYRFSLE